MLLLLLLSQSLLTVICLTYESLLVMTEAFHMVPLPPALQTLRRQQQQQRHASIATTIGRYHQRPDDSILQVSMSSSLSNDESLETSSTAIVTVTADGSEIIILPNPPIVPVTLDAMIKQVATAMRNSATSNENGSSITRQIIRILLPRDKNNADIGRYFETYDDSNTRYNNDNIVLCPTDESWQGGIMQLYRSAAPTVQRIIRTLSNDVAGVPLRIVEDRTIDESGVDGVGVLSTSDQSIICYVQPTQEIVDEYINTAQSAPSSTIVALINPQWRQVNDALDEASVSNSNPFLSNLASFLGGKGNTLKRIKDVGYQPIYTLEGYVCRGTNIRLLQILGYDTTDTIYNNYHVYVERDDIDKSYFYVGTCNLNNQRPTYQQVDTMLQNANIGYKYARDIGLQPKL